MISLRSFWTSHETDQVLLLRTTQLFINKTFLHSHILKDTFISIKSLIRTFEASIIHPPTYSRKFTIKTFFPWSVGLRQTGRKYYKRQNVSVSKAKTTADRTCRVGLKVDFTKADHRAVKRSLKSLNVIAMCVYQYLHQYKHVLNHINSIFISHRICRHFPSVGKKSKGWGFRKPRAQSL